MLLEGPDEEAVRRHIESQGWIVHTIKLSQASTVSQRQTPTSQTAQAGSIAVILAVILVIVVVLVAGIGLYTYETRHPIWAIPTFKAEVGKYYDQLGIDSKRGLFEGAPGTSYMFLSYLESDYEIIKNETSVTSPYLATVKVRVVNWEGGKIKTYSETTDMWEYRRGVGWKPKF